MSLNPSASLPPPVTAPPPWGLLGTIAWGALGICAWFAVQFAVIMAVITSSRPVPPAVSPVS